LIWCGVTHATGVLCSGGCGVDEDVNHLILGCTEVQGFWSKIVNWMSFYCPLPIVITEHATQFCNIFLYGKEAGIGLQVIWLASC
jgi:hypothetical protein